MDQSQTLMSETNCTETQTHDNTTCSGVNEGNVEESNTLLVEKQKSLTCPVCERTCATKGALHKHMTVHNRLKELKCFECDKSFRSIFQLSSHLILHTGIKPFICSVCCKLFRMEKSLRKHFRQCHPNHPCIEKYHLLEPPGASSRPSMCPLCGSAFKSEVILTMHKEFSHGNLQKIIGAKYHSEMLKQLFEKCGMNRDILDEWPELNDLPDDVPAMPLREKKTKSKCVGQEGSDVQETPFTETKCSVPPNSAQAQSLELSSFTPIQLINKIGLSRPGDEIMLDAFANYHSTNITSIPVEKEVSPVTTSCSREVQTDPLMTEYADISESGNNVPGAGNTGNILSNYQKENNFTEVRLSNSRETNNHNDRRGISTYDNGASVAKHNVSVIPLVDLEEESLSCVDRTVASTHNSYNVNKRSLLEMDERLIHSKSNASDNFKIRLQKPHKPSDQEVYVRILNNSSPTQVINSVTNSIVANEAQNVREPDKRFIAEKLPDSNNSRRIYTLDNLPPLRRIVNQQLENVPDVNKLQSRQLLKNPMSFAASQTKMNETHKIVGTVDTQKGGNTFAQFASQVNKERRPKLKTSTTVGLDEAKRLAGDRTINGKPNTTLPVLSNLPNLVPVRSSMSFRGQTMNQDGRQLGHNRVSSEEKSMESSPLVLQIASDVPNRHTVREGINRKPGVFSQHVVDQQKFPTSASNPTLGSPFVEDVRKILNPRHTSVTIVEGFNNNEPQTRELLHDKSALGAKASYNKMENVQKFSHIKPGNIASSQTVPQSLIQPVSSQVLSSSKQCNAPSFITENPKLQSVIAVNTTQSTLNDNSSTNIIHLPQKTQGQFQTVGGYLVGTYTNKAQCGNVLPQYFQILPQKVGMLPVMVVPTPNNSVGLLPIRNGTSTEQTLILGNKESCSTSSARSIDQHSVRRDGDISTSKCKINPSTCNNANIATIAASKSVNKTENITKPNTQHIVTTDKNLNKLAESKEGLEIYEVETPVNVKPMGNSGTLINKTCLNSQPGSVTELNNNPASTVNQRVFVPNSKQLQDMKQHINQQRALSQSSHKLIGKGPEDYVLKKSYILTNKISGASNIVTVGNNPAVTRNTSSSAGNVHKEQLRFIFPGHKINNKNVVVAESVPGRNYRAIRSKDVKYTHDVSNMDNTKTESSKLTIGRVFSLTDEDDVVVTELKKSKNFDELCPKTIASVKASEKVERTVVLEKPVTESGRATTDVRSEMIPETRVSEDTDDSAIRKSPVEIDSNQKARSNRFSESLSEQTSRGDTQNRATNNSNNEYVVTSHVSKKIGETTSTQKSEESKTVRHTEIHNDTRENNELHLDICVIPDKSSPAMNVRTLEQKTNAKSSNYIGETSKLKRFGKVYSNSLSSSKVVVAAANEVKVSSESKKFGVSYSKSKLNKGLLKNMQDSDVYIDDEDDAFVVVWSESQKIATVYPRLLPNENFNRTAQGDSSTSRNPAIRVATYKKSQTNLKLKDSKKNEHTAYDDHVDKSKVKTLRAVRKQKPCTCVNSSCSLHDYCNSNNSSQNDTDNLNGNYQFSAPNIVQVGSIVEQGVKKRVHTVDQGADNSEKERAPIRRNPREKKEQVSNLERSNVSRMVLREIRKTENTYSSRMELRKVKKRKACDCLIGSDDHTHCHFDEDDFPDEENDYIITEISNRTSDGVEHKAIQLTVKKSRTSSKSSKEINFDVQRSTTQRSHEIEESEEVVVPSVDEQVHTITADHTTENCRQSARIKQQSKKGLFSNFSSDFIYNIHGRDCFTLNPLISQSERDNRRKAQVCKFCGKVFTQVKRLQNHVKVHHRKMQEQGEKNERKEESCNKEKGWWVRQPFKCRVCGLVLPSLPALGSHSKVHIMEKRFKKLSNNDQTIVESVSPHREKAVIECRRKPLNKSLWVKQPFKCKVCDSVLPSLPALGRHSKLHLRRKNASKSEVTVRARHTTEDQETAWDNPLLTEQYFECKECHLALPSFPALEIHSKEHIKDSHSKFPSNDHEDTDQEHSEEFTENQGLEVIKIKNWWIKKPYQCKVCALILPSLSALGSHSKIHTKESNSKTLYRKAEEKENLENTVKRKVSGGSKIWWVNRSVKCRTCGLLFPTLPSLGVHAKSHVTDKYSLCEFCGQTFSLQAYLTDHLKSSHFELLQKFQEELQKKDVKPAYTCCMSNMMILRKEYPNIRSDIWTKRKLYYLRKRSQKGFGTSTCSKPIKRSHLCIICRKTYLTKFSLNMHVRSHKKTTILVNGLCGKSFSDEKSMIYHLKLHADMEASMCRICGEICTTSDELLSHQRSVHSVGKRHFSSSDDSCSSLNAYKLYKNSRLLFENYQECLKLYNKSELCTCDLCGVSFANNAELIEHSARHTNRSVYVCNLCEKLFSDKSSLLHHSYIHLSGKLQLYSCVMCHIPFDTEQGLKLHVKCHIDTKIYSCNTCNELFWSNEALLNHQKLDLCYNNNIPYDNPETKSTAHEGVSDEVVKRSDCEVCNKHFEHSEHLFSHLRTHVV